MWGLTWFVHFGGLSPEGTSCTNLSGDSVWKMMFQFIGFHGGLGAEASFSVRFP